MQKRALVAALIAGSGLSLAMGQAAHAGGLEANGYNWDLMFDPATYASRAEVTYVNIDHEVSSGGSVVATTPAVTYYNIGFKADIVENTSCLGSIQNPFGRETDRTQLYAATNSLAVSESIESRDVGLTCMAGMQAGPGIVSIIGGVSAQNLSYDASIPTGATTTAALSMEDWGWGWRIGAAYEIPEYALRVSAIYNSKVSYDLTGTIATGTAAASADAPQSFEVKAQTGVAPGWLVLGSVKWTDWSSLQALTVNTSLGAPFSTLTSDFQYRDGWMITAGVGHAVTEDISLLGVLTWDRGTSTPGTNDVLLARTQTDRWGAALGGAIKLNETVELNGGVSVSLLEGGSNADGESWGRGYVTAFRGGITGRF